MSKYDTEGTDWPTCPYCGEHWYPEGDETGECECPSCGESISVDADYSVTYTTRCKRGEHTYDVGGYFSSVAEEVISVTCQRCGRHVFRHKDSAGNDIWL